MDKTEEIATAKVLKAYGKTKGEKYTTLKKNYLINSTRKYDDLGDWLYFKHMVKNACAIMEVCRDISLNVYIAMSILYMWTVTKSIFNFAVNEPLRSIK